MIFIHLLKLGFLQMTDLSRSDMLVWGLSTLYKNTLHTLCILSCKRWKIWEIRRKANYWQIKKIQAKRFKKHYIKKNNPNPQITLNWLNCHKEYQIIKLKLQIAQSQKAHSSTANLQKSLTARGINSTSHKLLIECHCISMIE